MPEFAVYHFLLLRSQAVDDLNGKDIDGRELFVAGAQKTAKRQNAPKENFLYHGTKLYVANLDYSIDDERLRKEFSHFGTVTFAKVTSTITRN